jgi:hypothetical protein
MIIYGNKIYFVGKFHELLKILRELSVKYTTISELISLK